MPNLREYRAAVEETYCRYCETEFPPNLDYYEHRWGWVVTGFARKQWLYITCVGCGNEWSLEKLGVSRTRNVGSQLVITAIDE